MFKKIFNRLENKISEKFLQKYENDIKEHIIFKANQRIAEDISPLIHRYIIHQIFDGLNAERVLKNSYPLVTKLIEEADKKVQDALQKDNYVINNLIFTALESHIDEIVPQLYREKISKIINEEIMASIKSKI